MALQLGCLACVHSYDIPPIRLLKPQEELILLTPLAQKAALLDAMGIQALAISHFDRTMMEMRGTDFFREVLLGRLHAAHIVAGYDHRFGHKGDTDTAALQALCDRHGVGLSVVSAVKTASGQVVSSTVIREALQAGNWALAEEMLGRQPDPALIKRIRNKSDTGSS